MGIPMQSHDTLGVGIYSFADAARFIGAKPADLRRWMHGYSYSTRDGQDYSAPLWDTQLADTDIDGLGFKDLIELRFVQTFRDAGVPLTLIRNTLIEAKERLSTPYPFTCKKFKTDGKRIFMEVVEKTGDESLVDVVKRQNVIAKIIGPSLREGVEHDMRGNAARWFPIKNSKAVVFDPARKFGQPILTEFGVPTAAISEAVKAEGGDQKLVARIYEVSIAAVKKAVEFENRIVHS